MSNRDELMYIVGVSIGYVIMWIMLDVIRPADHWAATAFVLVFSAIAVFVVPKIIGKIL